MRKGKCFPPLPSLTLPTWIPGLLNLARRMNIPANWAPHFDLFRRTVMEAHTCPPTVLWRVPPDVRPANMDVHPLTIAPIAYELLRYVCSRHTGQAITARFHLRVHVTFEMITWTWTDPVTKKVVVHTARPCEPFGLCDVLDFHWLPNPIQVLYPEMDILGDLEASQGMNAVLDYISLCDPDRKDDLFALVNPGCGWPPSWLANVQTNELTVLGGKLCRYQRYWRRSQR